MGIDPVAFAVGPFIIRWYGIMVALAIAVIVAWAWRGAKRAGISEEVIYTTALCAIPTGVIVSRLLHVIDLQVTGQEDYFLHPERIIGFGGLTIFGAILGGALGGLIYSWVSRISFGQLADLVAPAIPLAQAIGRLGCLINGCCYGKPTSLPWGLIYMHPNGYAPLGVPVHPTQIYEIVGHFIIFGVLWVLRGKLRPEGSLFLIYLALFSVVRFAVSFVREGSAFLGPFQQPQVIALLLLAIAIPLLAIRTRWMRPSVSTSSAEGE